jgi:uncharacterized sulfatase
MRLLTLILLAACAAPGPGQAPARPPNVVLILSDDHGWTDYGFMGHPVIKTPHLDRLASQSVLFTRGYVAAPLCCPSLASILSGLHPHQHRITSNDPKMPAGQPRSKAWKSPEVQAERAAIIEYYRQAPMLPRLLAPLGCTSFQAGKWWGGNFDTGGFTQGMTHGDVSRGGRHGDAGLDIGRKTMQPVLDFIDATGDKPFFLWYAPMLPHDPHVPPDRILAKYKDKSDSIHVAKYWAMVEWFDETCGQLLDHLHKKGLADNTMILYLCDNGWTQKKDGPGFGERSKRNHYDEGVRTPIMVRWPARAKPRRDDATPVSSIDLVPTVLAACGLKPDPAMQGVNLLDEAAVAAREAVFGARYTHDFVDCRDPKANLLSRWAVSGRWKLIVPWPEGAAGLYDLKADPREEKDLAADRPDEVARMKARLDAWWKPGAK